MTIKELKGFLAEAPDDLPVMVLIEDHTKPGMFAFAEACTCDTGVSTLGPDENGQSGETAFLVLPHGYGVSEDDLDSGKAVIPDLN